MFYNNKTQADGRTDGRTDDERLLLLLLLLLGPAVFNWNFLSIDCVIVRFDDDHLRWWLLLLLCIYRKGVIIITTRDDVDSSS